MLTGSRASIAGAREAACAAREAGEAGGADERFSARRYGRHGRGQRSHTVLRAGAAAAGREPSPALATPRPLRWSRNFA